MAHGLNPRWDSEVMIGQYIHAVERVWRRDGAWGTLRAAASFASKSVSDYRRGVPLLWRQVKPWQSKHRLTPAEVVELVWETGGGLIRPAQVREEIMQMASLVDALRPARVLEVGTANGGTFFVWCQLAATDALLTSIDLPGGIHGGGYPAWKTPLYRSFARQGQRTVFLRADSHREDTRRTVEGILAGEPVDFLFIDGDHTYDGVRRDFDNYSRLVRPGGMIALHDICPHTGTADCKVDLLWNELKREYRHHEIIHNPNQGWAGIGVLYVPDERRPDASTAQPGRP